MVKETTKRNVNPFFSNWWFCVFFLSVRPGRIRWDAHFSFCYFLSALFFFGIFFCIWSVCLFQFINSSQIDIAEWILILHLDFIFIVFNRFMVVVRWVFFLFYFLSIHVLVCTCRSIHFKINNVSLTRPVFFCCTKKSILIWKNSFGFFLLLLRKMKTWLGAIFVKIKREFNFKLI